MAKWTYDSALDRLLKHEGGYSNHPSDPGGPTKYGITLAVYRQYVLPGATADDVKAMTLAQAKRVYRARYWDALRCDDLPAGVDYAVFDYGVNSGVGRSAKVLQRIVGVTVDGRIGTQTLAAVATWRPADLINAICDERLAFLKRLRTWPVFGKGWGRRVAEVRSIASAMAEKPAAIPDASEGIPGKAPKEANRKSAASGAGAGAAIAAVAAGAGGLPWWQIGLIVAGVALVAFLAVHFISKRD